MSTIARLKDGDLLLAGEINERLPVVTNGLVAHFPFDGVTMDGYGGHNPIQSTESYNNLIELHDVDWRNPLNWSKTNWQWAGGTPTVEWDDSEQALKFTAGSGWVLNQWIQIDPNKKWFIEARVKTNKGHAGFYLGDISYNKDKAQTAQHPGTYEYWGASNMTIPTQYTTIKNGYISGQPRTGTSSTVGHTDKWNTNMFYIKPHIITNHSGKDNTHITWISDLRLYYIDDNNSNTTLTSDGISVEEATTNLITSTDYSSYGGYSPLETTVVDEYVNNLSKRALRVKMPLNVSFNDASRIHHYSGIVADGRKATFSVYAKAVNSQTVGKSLSVYTGTWSSESSMKLTMDYQRFEFKDRPMTTTSCGLRVHSWENGDEAIFYSPQLEEKPFATSFVDGSRGSGRVDVPFVLKPPYSINVWHKSIKPLSEVINQYSSPMIFQMNGYYTNASISFWNYNKALTVYIKGDTSAGWTTSKNYKTFTSDIWDNKEHMYTLVAVDNRTFKVYMDGVYLGQQTSTEDVTNITYLSMGNTYMPNAIYRDLSIYNRALTDDEVKKMEDYNIQLTKSGDLINSTKESINVGNGSNGTLTVSTLNTEVNKYAYITSNVLKDSTSIIVEGDVTNNFLVHDEIMIIQMQDALDKNEQVGLHEYNRIKTINYDSVNLVTNITLSYPTTHKYTSGSPNVINTSYVSQIVKIPQYTSVTINSNCSLTAPRWNGKTGGVLAFRCQGDVLNNGTIDVSAKGYRGGRATGIGTPYWTELTTFTDTNGDGENGEGYTGLGRSGFYNAETVVVADNGGTCYVGGSGGSHRTKGEDGINYTANPAYQTKAGYVCGDGLSALLMFGGGGAGGHNNAGKPMGGSGGGIIVIFAKSVNGEIKSKGQDGWFYANDDGAWGSGGGAGGSIYVESESFIGNMDTSGGMKKNGSYSYGTGGDGGAGYSSAITYNKSLNIPMKNSNGVIIRGSFIENTLN